MQRGIKALSDNTHKIRLLPQPNSTQSWVALFSYAKTTTTTVPTLSQLLHNQTQPNSVCNPKKKLSTEQ